MGAALEEQIFVVEGAACQLAGFLVAIFC